MTYPCGVSVRERTRKNPSAPSSGTLQVEDGIRPCLREVELFKKIPPAELDGLNRMLPLKTFAAGQVIYDPFRPVQILFIVKTGRVRLFQTGPSGKTFTLAIYEPGDVFGNMAIVGQNMGASHAEALEESSICQLGRAQVETFFLEDPRISHQVTAILARRVSELETRLSDLALRPLPQRVASLLLSTARPSHIPWKNELIVTMTHEQLASVAGSTREAVSKTLADLARQGLIVQRRGSIVLVQPEQLELFKGVMHEQPTVSRSA